MFGSLIDIFRSYTSTVRKDAAVKYLNYIVSTLNDEILPTFDSIIGSKDLPVVKKNSTFTTIYKGCNIIAPDNYKALEKMRESFAYIARSHSKIKVLVDRDLHDVLTNKSMSAKTAAILKLLHDLAAMNSYILDLMYYIIVDEKVSDLPKIKFKRIKEGMTTFIDMFKIYGYNFDKLLDDISRVSDEPITNYEENKTLIDTMLSKTGKLVTLPISNFLGNPIYHIRLWLTDRDIKKYESLKVKKQLIELRLMELKLEAEDDSDPALSKQIKYYEEKLANIEYAIEKLEK